MFRIFRINASETPSIALKCSINCKISNYLKTRKYLIPERFASKHNIENSEINIGWNMQLEIIVKLRPNQGIDSLKPFSIYQHMHSFLKFSNIYP